MKWYYAEGGKQLGPIEESDLDELVRQGAVRDETLVWREGMSAWQRHAAVRGSSSGSSGAAPAVPPVPVTAGAGDTRYCSECGRAVPASQMSTFGDISVCTQCQPAYSQRLREGGSTRRFGGFWIRFLAIIIDAIILGVVGRRCSYSAGSGDGGSWPGHQPQSRPIASAGGCALPF